MRIALSDFIFFLHFLSGEITGVGMNAYKTEKSAW